MADALVLAGTSVTIRYLSGAVVLQTIVETSQARTRLTDHIRQKCAESAYIPLMCVRLEWAQPVRIQGPPGFELGQSSMHMAATLVPTAIPDDFDPGSYYVPHTCVVCSDAALDVDDLNLDRSSNYVRCLPCALC